MGLLPENIRTSIAGFPTIQVLRQGKAIEEYMGDRTKDNLRDFINKYITAPPPSAPPVPSIKKSTTTPKTSASSKATPKTNTKKKAKTAK